jgi:DHA1 family multidrug resistance protein-like MFS transporter
LSASDSHEAHTAGWQRTLFAMLAVQLVIGMAFSIVPPVLPLRLPAIGVTDQAAIREWSGLLIGITPLAAALTSPFWGHLIHRIDPRRILAISCLSAAACTTAMSAAATPWQFLLLRFLMGLFGGHIAAAMSIVSSVAPTNRLGASLGWLATAQLSGALLGPLLGGVAADGFGSLRAPFFVGGGAALLVCLALTRVPALRISSPRTPDGAAPRSVVGHLRALWGLALALLLAQCAIMGPQPIVALRVRELVGERGDVATLAGAAFSVVTLSGLLGAPLMGRLSDAFGARRLLFGLLACAAVGCVAQAYAATYGGFVAARFGAGLFLCSLIPSINTLAAKSVPPHERGGAFGLAAGAAFFGAFLGPLGCGLLAAHWGLRSAFLLSAALLLVDAVLLSVRGTRTAN